MPDFDVFISFKNLGADGAPTPDSVLAREVCEFLTARGLSVFFSNISLEAMGVAAYQRAIDEALDAATVLVAVGTSRENLESQWVRYEWSSFYNDILSELKRNGRVFVYSKGIDIFSLPRILRQNQVFVHQKNALESLANFILNALGRSPRTSAGPFVVPTPPKGHVARLALCSRCGHQFDLQYPSPCSFHPAKPVVIGNTGPREDYRDVWKFECCGTLVVNALSRGVDLEPAQSPRCQVGKHAP